MKLFVSLSGVSPILYHATSLGKLLSMLQANKFELTTDLGTDADKNQRSGKKHKSYYISTTRHRHGGYHKNYVGDGDVLIEFDGRKLNHIMSGKAVDYWGEEYRKIDPTKFEAEDRLWSNKDEIPNIAKYIKSVTLAYMIEERPSKDTNPFARKPSPATPPANTLFGKRFRATILQLHKHKIPVRIYNDKQHYLSDNKQKAIKLDPKDLKNTVTSVLDTKMEDYEIKMRKNVSKEEFKDFDIRVKSLMAVYTELFYKKKVSELSRRAKDLLPYVKRDLFNERIPALKADIHNARTSNKVANKKLTQLMKDNKFYTIEDFFKHVQNKWRTLGEED